MIVITKRQYEDILIHSQNALPNEACGLLGGKIEGGNRIVEKVYLLTNIDNSPEHFSMEPKEQFFAIKDMRSMGCVMLGNFHSHPSSPARPSDEDKKLAFDGEASYMIISLIEQGNIILKSFKIENNTTIEEKLLIKGE